jgi:hypothetical protein
MKARALWPGMVLTYVIYDLGLAQRIYRKPAVTMFKVSADHPSGQTVSPSTHTTARDAFITVVDLMIHGMINVRIVDNAGRQFTPTEFAKEIGELANETDMPSE